MSRTINCIRLGREAEALDIAPYPGELGQRILEQVSKQGWQEWLVHQTMLINENRITPMDPDARKFLVEEMQKFLFEGGAEAPEGYVPPSEDS